MEFVFIPGLCDAGATGVKSELQYKPAQGTTTAENHVDPALLHDALIITPQSNDSNNTIITSKDENISSLLNVSPKNKGTTTVAAATTTTTTATTAVETSLGSSVCLTDAVHTTTTNTMTSSIFSATPALQQSINAFALLWENGVNTIPASLGTVLDVSEMNMDSPSCPDGGAVSFLSNSADEVKVHTPSVFFSVAQEKTKQCPNNEKNNTKRNGTNNNNNVDNDDDYDDDIFSMLHVQPYMGGDDILGSVANNSDTVERCDDEECMEMPLILPVFSPTPSECMDEDNVNPIDEKETEEKFITVVDPQRSKLRIPISAVSPTKALGAHVKNPSLCFLFQSSRCRQGTNCHQVHVDPELVQRLREIADNLPCCCTFHGDCNTKFWNASANSGRSVVINGVLIPLSRVAYTSGVTRFITNTIQRPLSRGALCRLHGKPGGCRYGADCWYLHVCREILEKEFSSLRESNPSSVSTGGKMGISSHVMAKNTSRPYAAQRNSLNTHLQHHQQFQQQQQQHVQHPAGFFHTTNGRSPVMIITPFANKDTVSNSSVNSMQSNNNNNNNNTNAMLHPRDPAMTLVPPCMWVHPASLQEKPVPMYAEGTPGGNKELHHGQVSPSNTLPAGIFPQTIFPEAQQSNPPHEHTMPVSMESAAAPTMYPFLVWNGGGNNNNNNTAATPSSSTNTTTGPSYFFVKQNPTPAMTVMQLNSSPAVAYPAVWLPQQPQQGPRQHTYIHQQGQNMNAPSAFVGTVPGYSGKNRPGRMAQHQRNAKADMTLPPVMSFM